MLKILQIEKNADFYSYLANLGLDLTIISPNPQMADTVRNNFSEYGTTTDSITIAKFIKDQLNELQIAEVLENFRGKSELILLLGAIWKKIGREPNYVKFNRAFNLLTELRSFSLSEQVLDTVLEQYDSEIRESVLWLYRFLVQMEIVDEHHSYFILSEKLRESDLPVEYSNDQQLIFYGFDYLAASQVDLIKSLSLRNDVYIPVYKSVMEKSHGMDWINWFDEHNKEIIDIGEFSDDEIKLTVLNYPRGYLAKSLKNLASKNSEIVLGTKDLTREYVQEISLAGYQSKISINIFEHDFEQVRAILFDFIDFKVISTDEVRSFIQSQLQTHIEKQEFRLLKCYFIMLGKINEWESLSDDNNKLDQFDLEILTKAAVLDLPRTNLTGLTGGKRSHIYSLKHLQEINDKRVFLVLNSNYLSLASSGGLYTENVEKYLASIGPVRRSEFDLSVLKAKLREFCSENEVQILMENGYLDHEPVWSDLLDEFQLEEKRLDIDFHRKKFLPEFATYAVAVDRFSASKIQRYLDCPQKYFQQYGLKQSPEIQLPSQLSVLDLGQLEHKIIEKYFEKQTEYNEQVHNELVNYYLKNWTKDKVLAEHIFEEYFIEIISYTRSIIEILGELKSRLGLAHHFEFDFIDENLHGIFNGSIDCYLFEPSGGKKIILDFKRSNSLFTSFKSVLEYDKIQLWFYLKRLVDKKLISVDDEVAIGYVDLSHHENSMLFVNDNDLLEILKNDFGFKKSVLFENFPEQLQTYSDLEMKLVTSMKSDQYFLAQPKDEKVCSYCSIKNVCAKGEYGHS